MKIGIHKDQNGRVDPYLQIYEHILNHNRIENLRIEASQPDFWEIVSSIDLIIFHWVYIDRDQQMAESLIPVIEKEIGIKCFPDWSTFWHYNNKIKQYYLLKAHNFPVIESYIFWEKTDAEAWLNDAEYPLVFKLSRGAFSQDVILVKTKVHAQKIINLMFGKGAKSGDLFDADNSWVLNQYKKKRKLAGTLKQKLLKRHIALKWEIEKGYALFQQFMPENDYTTRITIIGDRAFAFIINNVEGDFRAFDMQQIDFDPANIDVECVNLAFQISKTLGFQCMAYDFLLDENRKPVVCEMGYTSYALDLYNCTGYWDSSLDWHPGHFWPQYFQLIDLLSLPQLKQPQIDINLLK